MRDRRKAAGLSQEALAELVRTRGGKLSTPAVTRIERGTARPRRQTVEWIDAALDAGGVLLDAFGYTAPASRLDDLSVEVAELRRAVSELQALTDPAMEWLAGVAAEVGVAMPARLRSVL